MRASGKLGEKGAMWKKALKMVEILEAVGRLDTSLLDSHDIFACENLLESYFMQVERVYNRRHILIPAQKHQLVERADTRWKPSADTLQEACGKSSIAYFSSSVHPCSHVSDVTFLDQRAPLMNCRALSASGVSSVRFYLRALRWATPCLF